MENWVVTAREGRRTVGDCGAAPSTQSWRGGSAVEQHELGDPQREGTLVLPQHTAKTPSEELF